MDEAPSLARQMVHGALSRLLIRALSTAQARGPEEVAGALERLWDAFLTPPDQPTATGLCEARLARTATGELCLDVRAHLPSTVVPGGGTYQTRLAWQ